MNEIAEWILTLFVVGYIAGLITGIFIKVHHRTREIPTQSTRPQLSATPQTTCEPRPPVAGNAVPPAA